MEAMLHVLFVLAAIIFLVALNGWLARFINRKNLKLRARIIAIIFLIIVNLIVFFWLDGIIGKIMFLFPFVLLGPTYPLFKRGKI